LRKLLFLLMVLGAMVLPSAALAGGSPPVTDETPSTPPAAVQLPSPGPVVDVPSAEAFAKLYVAQHVRQLIGVDSRRVRVVADDAACLQSPVVATRFGCVFTLKAVVISRRGGWDWGHDSRAHSAGNRHGHDGHDRGRGHNRRYRVRSYGCLGGLVINGGPTVTPTATVRFADCARIPNSDSTVVAPDDTVAAPTA
jgi:hypothetical protein